MWSSGSRRATSTWSTRSWTSSAASAETKETKGDKAGYTYDETAYPVTVTVTDDPVNGKLLADVSYGEASESEEAPTAVDVVNQFDMTDVDVTLTLTKTIEDQSNSAKDGTFNFTLY
ncbi:MAG: hypothetical protein IJH08_06185, partial [Atopobiaceae bacterium]|nr:hypothetical protein [Atopobiaceae bacterium]